MEYLKLFQLPLKMLYQSTVQIRNTGNYFHKHSVKFSGLNPNHSFSEARTSSCAPCGDQLFREDIGPVQTPYWAPLKDDHCSYWLCSCCCLCRHFEKGSYLSFSSCSSVFKYFFQEKILPSFFLDFSPATRTTSNKKILFPFLTRISKMYPYFKLIIYMYYQ